MTPRDCIAEADCYRACVATILGLPAHEVPDFYQLAGQVECPFEHSRRREKAARDFLAQHNLGLFTNYCNGQWSLEYTLDHFSTCNPGVPVILSGKPMHSLEPGHSVVALDGKIVHDPSGAGISGPILCDDGRAWWYFDVIAVSNRWNAEVARTAIAKEPKAGKQGEGDREG